MDLNKITVNDIISFINDFDAKNLTSLNEKLETNNKYGEHLQYRLIDNRIYEGLMVIDFVIPNNFTYTKTPISLHFDIRQILDDEVILKISKPEIRTYSYNGWYNPKLILSECNIKTIDEKDTIIEYVSEPLVITKELDIATIYKIYKARVNELNKLKEYIEYIFNETNWFDYYNIANFHEVKKWKCPEFAKNISKYFKYLEETKGKYINEILLADNVFNNFGKHVLTKEIPEKYNFQNYKTISEQIKKLINDKDLINEINKIDKIKKNINKAQLEYDNEKNNLFHKIREKYNIPLEELLIK